MLKTIKKNTGIFILGLITILNPIVVFATNTYAENGAKWVLDGIFWIVLVVGIFYAGMLAVKRNLIAAIGVIIATAVICIFCKEPTLIETIGNQLKGILGL